jgi:hypothetical protein
MKKNLKITTSCLMIVLTSSLSAQEPEIDQGCVLKYNGYVYDVDKARKELLVPTIAINTNAAKAENSKAVYSEDIPGESKASEYLIIKGEEVEGFTVNATPKKYDKARLIITQKGTWLKGFYFRDELKSYISACTRDEFKTGSTYLEDMKGKTRVWLIEAKNFGTYVPVYIIENFKELDDNYDWTVEWN